MRVLPVLTALLASGAVHAGPVQDAIAAEKYADAERLAKTPLDLAEVRRIQARYGEAEKLLATLPASAELHLERGRLYAESWRPAEAENELRAGLKSKPRPETQEALLSESAKLLEREGREWEALQALHQLAALREARYGASHPSVGVVWATIGWLNRRDEPHRLSESRRAYERAGAIFAPRLRQPATAKDYELLVEAAFAIGPFLEGWHDQHCILRRAQIAQIEKEKGRASRALIEPLVERASFCYEDMRRGQDESDYLRAREIAARDFGEAHPDVIYVDEHLENYYASREYDQERNQRRAAEVRQRIRRLNERLYGEDSLALVSNRLADYLEYLSSCRFDRGDCERTLDGFIGEYARRFGAQHPVVAMKMRAIVRTVQDASSSAQSERSREARRQYSTALHQKTLDLFVKVYSRDHPEWALQNQRRAEFLAYHLQQYGAAADALADSLPVYRKYYGANDEVTMDSAMMLVTRLQQAKRPEDAMKAAQEAVAAFDEKNPWGARNRLAELLGTLGYLQAQSGRPSQAEASLRRSLGVLAESGAMPERQAAVASQLAKLHRAQGAADKAARMEQLADCLEKTRDDAKPQCGAYP